MRAINDGGGVVDVRGTSTFEQGHIIDAVNVPLSEMEQKIGSLQKHKNGTLLVCCDNGLTAGKAGVWGEYEDYFTVNVSGTRHVLAACRQKSSPQLWNSFRRLSNARSLALRMVRPLSRY